VEVQGFKKFETKSNKVVRQLARNDRRHYAGGRCSETVTVEASASAIQTETSALGKLVEGKQISDLHSMAAIRSSVLLKPGSQAARWRDSALV
jgi:hypothetical protein